MASRPARVTCLLTVALALGASVAFGQGGSVTRVDQNDPSITYSGNWYSNSNPANSGGVAALTNAKGATATITFTGSGISWIGVVDGWSGLATVHLDGVTAVVDTYGNTTRYQQVLYVARGLSNGPHRLSIEVTHERDANTSGSWVWIDEFDIENGSGVPGGIVAPSGRVEENNPALLLTGRWFSLNNPTMSGGGSVLATDAGSRISISFDGTGVSWIGYRDEWSGVAQVYLDGDPKTTIDTYLSPSAARVALYSVGGLARGGHVLTIEATGTRNASSKASWVWVDAFDVVP